MGDGCCGQDVGPSGEEGEAPTRFWRIGAVRAAVIAGVLLVAGLGSDGAADLGSVTSWS